MSLVKRHLGFYPVLCQEGNMGLNLLNVIAGHHCPSGLAKKPGCSGNSCALVAFAQVKQAVFTHKSCSN